MQFEDYTCWYFKSQTQWKKHEIPYKVPTETRSKYNAALCEDVIDAIQNAQEARLDLETAKLTEFGASFRTKTEPSKVSVSCETA